MTKQRKSTATPALLTEEERRLMVMFGKLDPRQQRIAVNALQHLASR